MKQTVEMKQAAFEELMRSNGFHPFWHSGDPALQKRTGAGRTRLFQPQAGHERHPRDHPLCRI